MPNSATVCWFICRADSWSLGTILYIMLAGEFPFVRVERVMALTEGKHPPVKWPEDLNVSDEAKHLVSEFWSSMPAKHSRWNRCRAIHGSHLKCTLKIKSHDVSSAVMCWVHLDSENRTVDLWLISNTCLFITRLCVCSWKDQNEKSILDDKCNKKRRLAYFSITVGLSVHCKGWCTWNKLPAVLRKSPVSIPGVFWQGYKLKE